MMRFFDYNATTPLLPEARQAWQEANEQHWLNPSSPYRAAAAVHARLEAARERLATMLEIDPQRIVFNSGATEGNNAVFAAWAAAFGAAGRIAVAATEHPSVLEAARRYFGKRIDWLAPTPQGPVLPDDSELSGLAAVSVMAANNETGILNPWQEWSAACRERAIPFHCDASQWIGKMPLDGLGHCDFLTACAHKFGGPKGAGFLVVPEGYRGLLAGGTQERGHRAGTEDVAGILAMLAALEAVESKRRHCASLARDKFLSGLKAAVPDVEVVGEGAPALWNTASIIMPEFKSPRWIRALEKRGFLISAGSACSTGKEGPSHVLASLGVDPIQSERVLRISSGWDTSPEDWMALLAALEDSHQELKDEAAGSNSKVISV